MSGAEIALIGVAVVGLALSAYSTYSQFQYQQAMANYQAKAAAAQAAYQSKFGEALIKAGERNALATEDLGAQQAAVADFEARVAKESGAEQERQLQQNAARARGAALVSLAKTGVDTTGSPLDVLMENAMAVQEESEKLRYATDLNIFSAQTGGAFSRADAANRAAAIRTEAQFRAFGTTLQGNSLLTQSAMDRAAAGNFRRSALLGAGSTLFSGAADIGLRYPGLYGTRSPSPALYGP